MTHCKYLLPLLIVLTIGCGDLVPPKITADLSTPKSAALAYLEAIQKGDARMARALSFGTAEQKGWVDGRVALVDGMRNFDDALYAKFGHITLQVHTDMHDSLLKLADVWVTSISNGKVTADDEQGWIDPAKTGFFSHFVNTVYLKHFKEGWKVDLARTYADKVPIDQYASITADAHTWQQFGGAFQAVARDIKAGKFHNVDEANQALLDRMQSLRKD